MSTGTASLVGDLRDRWGTKVGRVEVEESGSLFLGAIDLSEVSRDYVELFVRYESLVNDQVLSVVDEVEAEIDSRGIAFFASAESPIGIKDLQVFPATKGVSFRRR